MFDVHRDVLSKFIKHPSLKDVATYHGYRGDYLLKMTTGDANLVELISRYCEMKSIDYVIKPNLVSGFEIYIIAIDEDVVPIKRKNESEKPIKKWFEDL